MGNNKLNNHTLFKKIEAVIKEGVKAQKVSVEKSSGLPSMIHVIVVSEKFKGKTTRERQEFIWGIFEKKLEPSEYTKISLCLTLTPEEAEKGVLA